ncbi:hypothetical protein BGZ94_008137 [Podila epigama]|nr:hypothetical protein BGZ94_008137 [Podila epigama]
MKLNVRRLFLSDSQKQVEDEVRNIGLAHTIRDLITGSNHEIHVDSFQKKQAVKALQKAKPAQVNELITILKAMPDPTVVEFTTVHNREESHHRDTPLPNVDQDGKESTSLPAGTSTTVVPAIPTPAPTETQESADEVVKAPSSWWAISFSSLLSGFASAASTTTTDSDSTENIASLAKTTTTTTTTTTVTTITATPDKDEKETTKSETTPTTTTTAPPEQGSETTPATTTEDKNKEGKGTLTKTTTTETTKSVTTTTPDKGTLVETINSIKKQLAALSKSPPTYMISAYTYWWGYEIYVPHKCMNKLQRVSNTSQIFFGFLSGAVTGIPALAALVPLSRIISAWVGFQWALIKAEDLGKGVVLSATWVLPVALAPRSWDHPGSEEDPPVPKSNMKKIKAT